MTDPLKTGDPTKLCPEWYIHAIFEADLTLQEQVDRFFPHSPVPGHSEIPDSNTDCQQETSDG